MIQLKNVQFQYPKGRNILTDVNLNFESGNIYGLFGRNGEGKSTLMKLMAGLLFPKVGSCQVMHKEVSHRQVRSLQDLFIIPEDFELPSVRVATYEKLQSRFYPAFDSRLFYKLISEFHLDPKDFIGGLSFGQKKKVLIAFGIATQTQFLLMDEPTNGLDVPSKSQFRKVIATVADQGKCIVIATHQVRDLHSLINHLIVLDGAKVTFDRSLWEVSKCLWFGKPNAENKNKALYTEDGFGAKAILPIEDKPESEIDLELLFNAVLEDPIKIINALNTPSHEAVI